MVTKTAKVDRVDAEIDEIAQRILKELESATATNLSDVRYAKKIVHLADIHLRKKGTTTDRKYYKAMRWN